MKLNSPRSLALIISLLFVLIETLAFGILYWAENLSFSLYYPLLAIALTFILSFFISQYLIYNFVIRKAKLAYRSIHQAKENEDPRKFKYTDDILEEVNVDVQEWMDKKSSEIARLKQLEVYRKEFLGNVSHELKTPIFVIQGYILTLLDGGLDDPAINKKYLEKAEKSINRMISIVNDLEEISRMEHGQTTLKFSRFDIVSCAREVMESIERSASERNIKLALKEGHDKPFHVFADMNKIKQVLTNLITNAINYGNESGYVRLAFYDMEDNVLVEIVDNGIGISGEHIPRLFERFYRVDKSRSTQTGGTGLGLAIVKHIIEAHKQTINIKSTPGKGTAVTFTVKKAD